MYFFFQGLGHLFLDGSIKLIYHLEFTVSLIKNILYA